MSTASNGARGVPESSDVSHNRSDAPASEVRRPTAEVSFADVLTTFLKIFGSISLVYLMGYYNFSMAWLLVGTLVYVLRKKQKKSKAFKLKIAREAATNEKASVLARVEDLPSWVYFPDNERAEWLNKILKHLWPYLGHFVKDFLIENIEPMVHTTLQSKTKFGSFKFAKLDLGDISPRIGGIKVYREHVARDEIIMDLELFYAGDCDIEVWVSKLRAGIKDIQLYGTLRVVLKPLITSIPLVGGVQVFFLNTPSIDFNLTNVADVLDLPGLRDILQKIIAEQISAIVVLPNKIAISLTDAVLTKDLRFAEPAGMVRINVAEARDLMKKDVNMLGFGKSDPYGIISVGAQVFKTKVINNTVNPVWDFYCEAIIDQYEGQIILAEFFDKDQGNEDDLLGRLSVEVQVIAAKGHADLWIPLEDAKSGQVHLKIQWLALSPDPLALDIQQKEVDALKEKGLSTAVLLVYVDSASGLPGAGKSPIEPCPFVRLTLGTQKQETTCQRSTNNPVWEQSFTFSVVNPDLQELFIDVVDMKSAKSLGNVAYNLSRLLNCDNLEMNQPIHLRNSGPESKIRLHLRLRILKSGVKVPLDVHSECPGPVPPPAADSVPPSPMQAKPQSVCPEHGAPASSVNAVRAAVLDSVDISQPECIRRRNVLPTIDSTRGLGQIQLTLRFSQQRNRLIVVVHKVVELPVLDVNDPPDPYVKLYLQPDKNRDSKRKTQVVKNSGNPTYDETFDYVMSQNDLNGCQLLVTVNNRSSSVFGKTSLIGQVSIDLAQLDLSKALTEWYELEPEIG